MQPAYFMPHAGTGKRRNRRKRFTSVAPAVPGSYYWIYRVKTVEGLKTHCGKNQFTLSLQVTNNKWTAPEYLHLLRMSGKNWPRSLMRKSRYISQKLNMRRRNIRSMDCSILPMGSVSSRIPWIARSTLFCIGSKSHWKNGRMKRRNYLERY